MSSDSKVEKLSDELTQITVTQPSVRVISKSRFNRWTLTFEWLYSGASASSEPAPAVKSSEASEAHEQIVTPWDVKGQVAEDGQQMAINYDKLIDQFGTRRVDTTLLERFEKVTGHRPHPLLRRGTFFSHRCVIKMVAAKLALIASHAGILIWFWIVMKKANHSSYILAEVRAVIACILVIWFPSLSRSIEILNEYLYEYWRSNLRWLQDVFNVPLVVQLTG